jgi:hypothetical protein
VFAELCVHGCLSVKTRFPETQINLHAGMGAILDQDEAYSLSSEEGAILLIIESDQLIPSDRAISTPQRIQGATWPSDRPQAQKPSELESSAMVR